MCKLARTTESAILLTFLVMNLNRWLKAILFWFFCHTKLQPRHSSQMEKFGFCGEF